MSINHLSLTTDAADHCATACLEFAQAVAAIQRTTAELHRAGGFGTLPSGIALQKKYSELAVGGPGSLSAMLQAHITVATNLAATFTAIGRNYVATDDAVAQRITAPR
ncbi:MULTISPECIES: hypothetical protein [unclassified Rhodococcus (in: high G+C Gram-positive bacteria)]|uniref:hypothetical protein n=1 Tax=unclassified Rhodococcus (in: high G+C Gram-positive bacteria) TaxID=192944 RepID=UPI0012E37B90|nr:MULTISPECIES: hypothetical protein [unclassified Rhodococcus (in: high G+C Gram-positive bacteria)]